MGKVVQVMAEFIGSMEHYDFVKGNVYPIEIEQKLFGVIRVTPCHGYDWKPYLDYVHAFPDLHQFFHVWKVQKVEHPNELGPFTPVDPADVPPVKPPQIIV